LLAELKPADKQTTVLRMTTFQIQRHVQRRGSPAGRTPCLAADRNERDGEQRGEDSAARKRIDAEPSIERHQSDQNGHRRRKRPTGRGNPAAPLNAAGDRLDLLDEGKRHSV
jgi:hypothetical protein